MEIIDDLDLRVELGDLVRRFADAPGERWTSQQITSLLSALLGDTAPCAEPAERLVPLAGANPIVLSLPYPVSANAYWATRIIPANREKGKPAMAITYVTKEAEAYKTQVGWKVRGAGLRQPITGRVQIDVRLYPARPQDWQKRQRLEGASWDDTVRCIDLDNANKVLLDALKGVAIEDDKWVRRIVAERMEPDADGARVVLTITPLSVEQPQAGLFDVAA